MAKTPPGTSTRYASERAGIRWTKWCGADRTRTLSKLADGKGRSSASASTKLMLRASRSAASPRA